VIKDGGTSLGSAGLPIEVQRLVEQHFETSTDVDVLLLLVHRQWDRGWDADEVATALRIHPVQAERILARMAKSGLLQSTASGYRYAPATPRLGDAVDALAALHPSYRPAIAALIFSSAE
jgi:DNA-binding IclR family transcriptional regulator